MRNALPTIPNGYTLIRPAGKGAHAKVYICLPDPAVISAQNALDEGEETEHVSNALLSQVVALKVSYTGSLRSEVRALKALRQQSTRHKGGKHCVQLLDFERPSPDPHWLVLSTTPVCCDLGALCDALPGALPKALLWLTVTQLYDAFWFLHRVCTPPMAHLDIGQQNITISYRCADSTGRPTVTLIDFGAAMFVPEAETIGCVNSQKDDVENLCCEIYFLCVECCEGGEPPSGVGAEKMQRFMRIWSDITNLEQLWAEFGGFSEEQLAFLRERDWREAKDVVLRAVRKVDQKEGSMRDAVRKILELED